MKTAVNTAGFILMTALPLAACDRDTTNASVSQPRPAVIAQDESKTQAKLAASVTVSPKAVPARWYTIEQVQRGEPVFAASCAACHGEHAQGAPNWRQKQPDGKYPPPPLNGTGHGWHHPLRALHYQIKNSLPGGQGNMPPFKDALTDQQIVDTIAWFQSKWPDEIYALWFEINARAMADQRSK